MAALSRPVVYGSLAVLAIGVVWWSGGDTVKPKKATSKKSSTSKKGKLSWTFSDADLAVHFDSPKMATRNIFKPQIVMQSLAPQLEQDQMMKVPASMAEGDSNWAYTGMVEVDGVRMALLENGSLKQSGYVREGQVWKKSRVVAISIPSITFAGTDGSEQTVFRYNPNLTPKPKAVPDSGFKPIDLSGALRGPIGRQPQSNVTSNLEISPIRSDGPAPAKSFSLGSIK